MPARESPWAVYDVFTVRNGEQIFLCAVSDAQWLTFCDVLDLPGLTQEAIAARSLRFAGWVANCIVADMPCREQNIATLRERLRAPCLGVVPHGATQPDEVAQRLDLAPLLA